MHIKMLKTESVELDRINTRNYPAGWEGEVDDDLAGHWIAQGSAAPTAVAVTKPVALTEQETAVLKAAAQQAIAAAQAQAAGEQVDPDTGEILDGDDADVDTDETTAEAGEEETAIEEDGPEVVADADIDRAEAAVYLAGLTRNELNKLAKENGVPFVGRARADLERDVLAARLG